MRRLALLSVLCACTTLSVDQREQLAQYQGRAQLYFERGLLEQSMIMIERGLELAPDDYKLRGMKGAVLVRASSRNPKLVPEANKLLEEVYAERSPMRHEPYALFYFALARQKLGLEAIADAIRTEDRARRAVDAAEQALLSEQADAERARGEASLREADELLDYMVERGELQRLTCKHKLQIAEQLGLDDRFEKLADAYLEASKLEQANVRRDIEQTFTPDYETERMRYLESLKDEELQTRALIANWHYDHQQLEKALEQLDVVLEIAPTRTADYYNRGRILLELERIAEAKADFTRFVASSQLPQTNERMQFAAEVLRR